MISQIILAGVFVVLLVRYFTSRQPKLPGPGGYPFIGIAHLYRPHQVHVMVDDWSKQYGPVYQFKVFGHPLIVLSGYKAIYESFVQKGMEFGERQNTFRRDTALKRTGILTSTKPDEKWRLLRKTSQKHLKQFGDGLSRLESIIQEVADDMFVEFREKADKPFNPKQVIFDTALNSIAFLITGERTRAGDSIVERMKRYEVEFLSYLSRHGPLKYFIIDVFPWLRFFNISIWQKMKDFMAFEQELWNDIMEMNANHPDARSLCTILMTHAKDEALLDETDAKRTSMNLLLAGVTTTSNTFSAGINILAHHPHIQEAILKEIHAICGEGNSVTLIERPRMPYCRAFILELLRYTSVVAMSVGHCTRNKPGVTDTIQGHALPKNARIQMNLWGMHNDPELWTDPEVFRPERFLDEQGEMVPADHPNRKHLMPFGAGPRVCLGEQLALTRLFLWVTTLVNKFSIQPAKGNHPSTLDTRKFVFSGVLTPLPYEVIFSAR